MASGELRRVLIAYKSLPRYRLEFFEQLRDTLLENDVELTVVYGQAVGADIRKSDSCELRSGIFRRNRVITLAGRPVIWQAIESRLLSQDLIIVEQASKLLLNYRLLLRQSLGGASVGFWGHGENLQRHTASAVGEAVKRKVSTLPHWWFAYTEGSKQRVERLGYPASRITVVQNAIDTTGLRDGIDALSCEDLEDFRQEYALRKGLIAIYIGSLYAEKRLEFLIAAASEIGAMLPGFRLLVGGDGPLRGLVERAAAESPVIRYLGRLDGRRRHVALAAADITLMPGLVGLAVLDAFAAGAPIVTTDVPYHSPEIEYVRSGENGIVLPRSASSSDYATAVACLLSDGQRLERLQAGCVVASGRYTTEEMVRRFSEGVHGALERRAA